MNLIKLPSTAKENRWPRILDQKSIKPQQRELLHFNRIPAKLPLNKIEAAKKKFEENFTENANSIELFEKWGEKVSEMETKRNDNEWNGMD